MNLAEFWRRLIAGTTMSDDEILVGLNIVVELPLNERIPFLGFVVPFARHARSDIRAAALSTLAGAHGHSAIRLLIDALDDPDPVVSAAARDSLRRSVGDRDVATRGAALSLQSAVWGHLLFHPRVEIRREALDPAQPPVGRRWHPFVHWDDETSRPLIEGWIERGQVDAATIRGLLTLVDRGVIPGAVARRQIACAEIHDLGQLPYNAYGAVINLRPLFETTPEEEDRFRPTPRQQIAASLSTTYFDLYFQLQLVGAAVEAVGAGPWPFELVRFVVLFDPKRLLDESMPLEMRRRAARALMHVFGTNVRHGLNDADVDSMLASPLCKSDEGLPLLNVVAGVMRLFFSSPYKQILRTFSIDAIHRAWKSDPKAASPFVASCPNDVEGLLELRKELEKLGPLDHFRWDPLHDDEDIRTPWRPSPAPEPVFPHREREPLPPDHHAVAKAEQLLAQPTTESHDAIYLRAILELAPAVSPDLAIRTARRLRDLDAIHHDTCLYWLIADEFSDAKRDLIVEDRWLLANQWPEFWNAIVHGVLLAGRLYDGDEHKLLDWLINCPAGDPAVLACYEAIVRDGRSPAARRAARRQLQSTALREVRVNRVARVFAWGVRLGRMLTGQSFKLQMLIGDALGYTRLKERVLYISAMPLLRGDPGAESIVRGLILHEYGHHLYHASSEGLAIWDDADRNGLGKLLNLVADEHLERNLRHMNPVYGEMLKSLNAYAFQRRAREMPLDDLIRYLGPMSRTVLPAIKLGVARQTDCVVIQNGRFHRELESASSSFSRFMRALRMGLGNRWDDPKVEAGLRLFRGAFRKSTMQRLYEIAKELREIFGEETKLLDALDQHNSMTFSDSECADADDEIGDHEVSAAVGKLLGPPRGERKPGQPPSMPMLNLNPETEFKPITSIVTLSHDPIRHAVYAKQVVREAAILRQSLRGLGIGQQKQRFRTSGRRLDRARTRDLVLKGDPRVLQSRETIRFTDLFLGVIVDCSGSMAGERMEKAKTFGTLIAEAVKGLREIDFRIFGFTDRTIYDAGTALRCAAHELYAHDGNNDAAALWHASLAARRSRRRAKLLIMISDGEPTECTVAALRNLVNVLSRRGFCCAQVAVAPMNQICFPHYILLQDATLDASVRSFAKVITRLVGVSLKSV